MTEYTIERAARVAWANASRFRWDVQDYERILSEAYAAGKADSLSAPKPPVSAVPPLYYVIRAGVPPIGFDKAKAIAEASRRAENRADAYLVVQLVGTVKVETVTKAHFKEAGSV